MNDTTAPAQPDRVVCPASKDTAVRLLVVAAALIGFGVYCFVDAFIRGKYPYSPFGEDINAWANWAFNHFGAFIFTGGGVVVLVRAVMSLRVELVADAQGVGFKGKDKLAWSDVTKVDSGDLQAKQILRLHHGQSKPLVLDGYKLNGFAELVDFVDRHTRDDSAQAPADE